MLLLIYGPVIMVDSYEDDCQVESDIWPEKKLNFIRYNAVTTAITITVCW